MPYFKNIFIQLGFESPAAQNVAFSCADLHKADQVLGFMLESGMQVLVQLYLNSLSNGETESAESFFAYVENTENVNIKLLRDVVLRYCLGYFMLKTGIRKNYFAYFSTGKDLVAPLFFGMNHPQYRKIYLYWDFDVTMMPKSMYDHIKETIGVLVENKVISVIVKRSRLIHKKKVFFCEGSS